MVRARSPRHQRSTADGSSPGSLASEVDLGGIRARSPRHRSSTSDGSKPGVACIGGRPRRDPSPQSEASELDLGRMEASRSRRNSMTASRDNCGTLLFLQRLLPVRRRHFRGTGSSITTSWCPRTARQRFRPTRARWAKASRTPLRRPHCPSATTARGLCAPRSHSRSTRRVTPRELTSRRRRTQASACGRGGRGSPPNGGGPLRSV